MSEQAQKLRRPDLRPDAHGCHVPEPGLHREDGELVYDVSLSFTIIQGPILRVDVDTVPIGTVWQWELGDSNASLTIPSPTLD